MKKLKRYVLLVIGMVIVFGMTGTVKELKEVMLRVYFLVIPLATRDSAVK